MKSKSFDLKRTALEKPKHNKTLDFTGYYKSAAETKAVLENSNVPAQNGLKNISSQKTERTPNKKKQKLEPLDISHIDIEGPSLDTSLGKNTPLNVSKLTSTPQASGKNSQQKVKSIMKNSESHSDEQFDYTSYNAGNKSKKRNKSVSFMLDDTEEVVVKKTKSNESIVKKPDNQKKLNYKDASKIKNKKPNKKEETGKENKKNDNVNSEPESVRKSRIPDTDAINIAASSGNTIEQISNEDKILNKRKFKKLKKQNSNESTEVTNENNNNENQIENKNRKAKKKKHAAKANSQQNADTMEADGEPAAKSQKKEPKPEAIAEDLESLSIGDNAHTLTNLLDEMTVVDKDKKKKNKKKFKKDKKPTPGASNSDGPEDKAEEAKEKIKWKKRKWNKDKKGEVDNDVSSTSVIVDNLPLSILCEYKKHLTEQFGKHGPIKRIGVAEVYPAHESKPVFTTTIQFETEASAVEALKEDGWVVCGGVVVVRRRLPPASTTLVVRSYGALGDQAVCDAFAAAGRIRAIRHLVKGKKAIGTVFVEFADPAALQRALSLEARVGGKRLHTARYEPRVRKQRENDSEPQTQ